MRNLFNILSYAFIAVFAGVVVIFPSCQTRPSGTLSEKEMIRLIADMQIAQAYAETEYYGDKSDSLRMALAAGILAKNKVTQAELDSSLAYYGRNIDLYSKLYEKVDKRIVEKQKKMESMNPEASSLSEEMGKGIWPYQSHGIIPGGSNSDSWVFSIPETDMEKGERFVWRLHFPDTRIAIGVLGVEYEDGTSELTSSRISNQDIFEITLNSDSSKLVTRIFGTLRFNDIDRLPVLSDSISLKRLPFDSIQYRYNRYNKKIMIPGKKTKSVKDTLNAPKSPNMVSGDIRNIIRPGEENTECLQ